MIVENWISDQIMCIKYIPCKDFLVRLKSQDDTDVDSFEEILEHCGFFITCFILYN